MESEMEKAAKCGFICGVPYSGNIETCLPGIIIQERCGL